MDFISTINEHFDRTFCILLFHYLWKGGERIEFGPEDLPAREPVPKIVKVRLILGTDVDGQNMVSPLLLHDVGRQVVDVAAVQQVVAIYWVTHGRHVTC